MVAHPDRGTARLIFAVYMGAVAWPLEPLHVRERLRRPWWLPLLIPGFLTVIVVIDSVAQSNAHITRHRSAVADIIGWVVLLFLVAVPSFFAGIRFIREALDESRRQQSSN